MSKQETDQPLGVRNFALFGLKTGNTRPVEMLIRREAVVRRRLEVLGRCPTPM